MISKTSVPAGSTATQIADNSLGRISWRCGFVICNHSDADIFVSVDGDAGVTDAAGAKPGIRIPAGGRFSSGELGHVPANKLLSPLFAVHAAPAAKDVTVHEL